MGRHRNAGEATLLHQGENCRAYEYLGAHRRPSGGCVFRVWAPKAEAVELVGDFCGWREGISMSRITDSGVWEAKLPAGEVSVGDKYKYRIRAKNGELLWRQDPYSFECERPPADASVISGTDGYEWRDSSYISYRKHSVGRADMNIYGVDLYSWLRGASGEALECSRIAEELAPYVKQLGCTHISLSGVREYLSGANTSAPFSYFAPDPRVGTPLELKRCVDRMHEAGVGVIFSFDISAFPACSLKHFDGGALYEYSDAFPYLNASRAEVDSFLLSVLTFWLDEYHMDGLLLDGVLKLFLGGAGGISAGRAVAWSAFLKKLYERVRSEFPDALLLTAEPGLVGERSLSWLEDIGFDGITDIWCDRGIEHSFAWQKALIAHKLTYKGHKLLFMGTEIGQSEEACRTHGVDWRLLDCGDGAALQLFTAQLGQFYLSSEALREGDMEGIPCMDPKLICYKREKGGERLLVLVNTSDKSFEKLSLAVPDEGIYEEVFNSDDTRYGGGGGTNPLPVESYSGGVGEYKYSVTLNIPPYTTILFRQRPKNARTKNT